ncbi:MAG: 50S ribosomal protein L11 methyltransferase [Pseudomonadota bacterium]
MQGPAFGAPPPDDDVVKATAVIGTGDAFAPTAAAILDQLSEMADEGEPVLSVYRAEQDGPWQLDILFTRSDAEARDRWLGAARAVRPDLPALALDPVGARDWVAEGQRALHPVRAGAFTVHGSHDAGALPPSRYNLLVDAGRAFGTAHHASTKGCLIALTRLAKRRQLGHRVHDVGTGTGVLAIAAERLGAKTLSGGDIDPIAVAVARQNGRANRLGRPILWRVFAGPFARADTVIANILARPLIAMAPSLSAATLRTLVLSGLRQRDRRRVEAAFLARGFAVAERIVVDDWATLVLQRSNKGGR